MYFHAFACFLLLFIFCNICVHGADYFSSLEEILKSEQAKQGSDALHSEFASDKPKEIEIVCAETPQVLIRDMMDAADNSEECMVLKVSGPKFNFRFAVNCDEDNESPADYENVEESDEEEEDEIESEDNSDQSAEQQRQQPQQHGAPVTRATSRPAPKPSGKTQQQNPTANVHLE